MAFLRRGRRQTLRPSLKPTLLRDQAYHAHYEGFKRQGKPFWPDVVIEDALVSVGVLVALLFLTVLWGAPLEGRADPTNSAYVPRPEWYFMWIFQLLKVFPGALEWVGVAGLPTVGILLLFLLPFLDRNPRRLGRFRPLALSLGVLGLAAVGLLTYQAFASTPRNVTAGKPGEEVKLTASQLAGRQLYNAQCAVCHTLNGEGGNTAPPLDGIADRMAPAFVHIYIEDPKAVNQFASMPPFLKYPDVQLLDHFQVEQIVQYLMVFR